MLGASSLRRPAWLLLVTSCALAQTSAAATGWAPARAAESVPAYHPSRLAGVGSAQQVIVVSARAWSSDRGRLRAYQRGVDGSWALRVGPVEAHLGRNGFVRGALRRQGTATTPAGTYDLPWAFGTSDDPGTTLRYRQVDGDDWWPYDPRDASTYNVFQPRRPAGAGWRTAWAEHLVEFGRQYDHAVVVGFNLPGGVHRDGGERVAAQPADTRLGGGIFLHVRRAAGRDPATTGCVAVDRTVMRRLLRWLDPAADPTIVMGPRSALPSL